VPIITRSLYFDIGTVSALYDDKRQSCPCTCLSGIL